MRTRFFQEGSPECPILAITDFDASEGTTLAESILRMQSAKGNPVIIEGDVRLTLETSSQDLGIGEAVGNQYVCALRESTWDNVIGLLEPFMNPSQSGYQWLDDSGAVRLLLSRTGEW